MVKKSVRLNLTKLHALLGQHRYERRVSQERKFNPNTHIIRTQFVNVCYVAL